MRKIIKVVTTRGIGFNGQGYVFPNWQKYIGERIEIRMLEDKLQAYHDDVYRGELEVVELEPWLKKHIDRIIGKQYKRINPQEKKVCCPNCGSTFSVPPRSNCL